MSVLKFLFWFAGVTLCSLIYGQQIQWILEKFGSDFTYVEAVRFQIIIFVLAFIMKKSLRFMDDDDKEKEK